MEKYPSRKTSPITRIKKEDQKRYETKVWEEPWLPTYPARPPFCCDNSRDDHLRVHHLIDTETNTWNSEMLSTFVAAADIPRVKSIRVSRTGRRDCYRTDLTKSGTYTVKSGYTVAHDLRTQTLHPLMSEPSTTDLKKATRKIKGLRKLKHFIWQAISGYVATAQNLRDRHCAQESTCVRCGADSETINHTLFECPPALQCWALSQIPTAPGLFLRQSLFENMDYLLGKAKGHGVNAETMKVFPWIMWYIRKARNEKLFNNKDITPLDTIQIAMREAESWTIAQLTPIMEDTVMNEALEDVSTMIQAPEPPRWRCQVDASWISSREDTGLGFVILDARATSLFGAKRAHTTESPLHAEAEGLIWAMLESLNRGYMSLHFESDCQQLVNLIQRDDEECPTLAPELDEIKAICSSFDIFSIAYVSWSLNICVDGLAKGVRSRDFRVLYVQSCAPWWLAPVDAA